MDPSTNEEFNNFMYRVTEVSAIIQKLGSKDKKVQEIGTLEADRYLNDDGRTFMATIDEDNVKLTLKNDRTVINKAGFLQETMDQETMSQGLNSLFIFPNFPSMNFVLWFSSLFCNHFSF